MTTNPTASATISYEIEKVPAGTIAFTLGASINTTKPCGIEKVSMVYFVPPFVWYFASKSSTASRCWSVLLLGKVAAFMFHFVNKK